MTHTSNKLYAAFAILAFSACGGTVEESGAGGNAGSGGTGGSGGVAGSGGSAGTGGTAGVGGGGVAGSGGSVPDACAVDADTPGPYEVSFVFENHGSADAYLFQGCRLRFDVKSCADDYQEPVAIWADCTVDCEDDGGCIACGACQELMVPIGLGDSHEDMWTGYHYTFGTSSQGCSCHNEFVAPAGKYRIEVPVYDGEDPYTAQVARVATADFTLPAPDGVVRIDVSLVYGED